MKRVFLIGLSGVASVVSGTMLAVMVFGLTWGLGDYSVGNTSDFTGGWFLGLLMLTVAFVVPFFACRPFGRLWWISSFLGVFPTILFLGGMIFTNLNMGNVQMALILPLGLLVAGSFIGGFVGKKATKSNWPSQPITGQPGSG